MGDLVLVDRPSEAVAVVTLNRPRKYNAISKALLEEFHDTLKRLAQEPDLRAMVLTGADPAFCAGLDLGELEAGVKIGHPDSILPLRDFPVPVIGAVNGVAVTGGLEFALACDFRIASERARFADTHTRVGIVPSWGMTARLSQAVGQSWARQMTFTGDFVDAPLALRIGLVNEVVAHDRLLPRAVELAQSIATTTPETLGRIREIYDLLRDGTGADGLRAELETGRDGLTIASPEDFAARRRAVFDRGRTQAR
ncbi:enoyl-CoA hydratase [Microbispora sp. NPDC046973]|uniref:enoyl-CoA hydratase n=1 Tax=Microbispora sp. NPDC046973 TaxID=3155022 RepID=UPI0033F75778